MNIRSQTMPVYLTEPMLSRSQDDSLYFLPFVTKNGDENWTVSCESSKFITVTTSIESQKFDSNWIPRSSQSSVINFPNKCEKLYDVLLALRELEMSAKQQIQTGFDINQRSLEDAYSVVNLWPENIPIPSIDIDQDGYVSLYIFDDSGFSLGGIEFYCKDHMAVFTIMHRDMKEAECGYLDSITDVLQFFKNYKQCWVD